MIRLLIAAVIGVGVIAIGQVVSRRKWSPPTQSAWTPPKQLDRSDFDDPQSPWLVAVFSSLSCDACDKAIAAASVLASQDVAYQNIAVEHNMSLHERYKIEQIPLLLIADSQGVVRSSFIGPPSATEVWAEMANLREHEGHQHDEPEHDEHHHDENWQDISK